MSAASGPGAPLDVLVVLGTVLALGVAATAWSLAHLSVPAPAGRYGLGQTIRVTVDPKQPDRCDLVRDSGLLVAIAGIAVTAVIISGVLLLALATGWNVSGARRFAS
jgi:hypothetical protein